MVEKTCGYLGSCLVALVCLIIVTVTHMLAWFDISVTHGLFMERVDLLWAERVPNLSLFFPLWIFTIWVFCYAWQLIWLLFGIELIVVEAKNGWLYKRPSLIPPSTYLSFALGLAGILCWLILWELPGYSSYAPIPLLFSCGCGFFSLARSLQKTINYSSVLKVQSSGEIILTTIFVHNGLGFFTTWCVTILLYQLCLLICVAGLVSPIHAAFIFMGVLLFYVIILFTADLFLAREITKGIVTPYIVTVLSYIQIVVVNAPEGFGHVFLVACVLLGFAILIFITKIIADIQRCKLDRKS